MMRMGDLQQRVVELETMIATMRMQMVDILPAATVPMARQPLLSDRGAAIPAMIDAIGGVDMVIQWDATRLYETDGRLQQLKATTGADMRVYPGKTVGRVDSSRWVFVGGPGPTADEDGTLLVPEFGRGAVFPLLMQHKMSYFNGQQPVRMTPENMLALYRGLVDASCTVLCYYEFPWTSWLEIAMGLVSIGMGGRNTYFIVQSEMSAQMFEANAEMVLNLPGTPHEPMTLRQRMSETYDIFTGMTRAYVELVRDDRVRDEYDSGKTVSTSFGSLVRTIGDRLVTTPQRPLTTGERNQFIQRVFGNVGRRSDIATYLRMIYLLAMYNTMQDEHGGLFATLRGEASGYLAGYDVMVGRWAQTSHDIRQHLQRMQPVAMLLHVMLRTYGVDVGVFRGTPADDASV